MENRTKLLQWHPAFFAGIQVDLDAEKSELAYDNEYQLGTKPKQIDVIILKKMMIIKFVKISEEFFENTTLSNIKVLLII